MLLTGNDALMKTAGVLRDLADSLASNAAPLMTQAVSCKDFLEELLSSDDHLINEVLAEWAKLATSHAVSCCDVHDAFEVCICM